MPSRWWLRAGIVGSAMMAAACGGGAPELPVIMTEFAFEPDRITVTRGQKTVLLLQNKGKEDHNFSIPQLNVTSANVRPGQKATFDVVAPRGPLKFACTLPGHEGMVGEITVQERRR